MTTPCIHFHQWEFNFGKIPCSIVNVILCSFETINIHVAPQLFKAWRVQSPIKCGCSSLIFIH